MPVTARSGNDPRQAQGIEKRDGGSALPPGAERILNGAKERGRILRRVAGGIEQHAAHIAAHRPLRERVACAARGKAADGAALFEHKRALAAKRGMRKQQRVKRIGVQRRVSRRGARRIPQTQNLRRVRAVI